jgi:imidazolonepropionase-like amidohydrolase
VRNGKIAAVGPRARGRSPGGHAHLTAKVVTPGLVDAHTVVGLAGYLNQTQDQDQRDPSGPIQPELRAIDAYNARERLVTWVRGSASRRCTPATARRRSFPARRWSRRRAATTVDEAVIVPRAMLAATLGDAARADGGKAPGTAASSSRCCARR